MKLAFTQEERIYMFSILQRLAFKSGEVNGRKARRKVQKLAEQVDPKRELIADLSPTQVDSLIVLLNGYAVLATSIKANPNTEKEKLDFVDRSLELIRSSQEKIDDKLKAIKAHK